MHSWTLGIVAAEPLVAVEWQYKQGMPDPTISWWLKSMGCCGAARDLKAKTK